MRKTIGTLLLFLLFPALASADPIRDDVSNGVKKILIISDPQYGWFLKKGLQGRKTKFSENHRHPQPGRI